MTKERLKEIQLKAEVVQRDNPGNRISKDLLELIAEVRRLKEFENKSLVDDNKKRGLRKSIEVLKEDNDAMVDMMGRLNHALSNTSAVSHQVQEENKLLRGLLLEASCALQSTHVPSDLVKNIEAALNNEDRL